MEGSLFWADLRWTAYSRIWFGRELGGLGAILCRIRRIGPDAGEISSLAPAAPRSAALSSGRIGPSGRSQARPRPCTGPGAPAPAAWTRTLYGWAARQEDRSAPFTPDRAYADHRRLAPGPRLPRRDRRAPRVHRGWRRSSLARGCRNTALSSAPWRKEAAPGPVRALAAPERAVL